jgi:ribosomal protein S18 acetylase RimI-like enzyme
MHRGLVLNVDARIQKSVVANLSGRPAPVEVGPFVIGVDPATASPGINYATPIPGLPITAPDITDLIAAFDKAQRQPRLEYVVSTAPILEDLLLAAGFEIEARHEYLICTPATLTVPATPDGFTLREPSTDEDWSAMLSAQHEGFSGEPSTPTEADIARMTRLQARGGMAVMAVTADGTCAGAGNSVPPNDRVSEVAGIAVRPPYRRRGVAAAVTADVTARLFAAGTEIAWLEAGSDDSWRVYERIGYRATGKRLYIAKP